MGKYRRKYLIYRGFQIKYSALIAFLCFLICLAFSSVIFGAIKQNGDLIHQNLLAKKDLIEVLMAATDIPSPRREVMEKEYMMIDKKLKNTNYVIQTTAMHLLIFSFAISIFVFGFGILITHRMAGPVFVMKRVLNDLIEGKESSLRPLRKSDEFKDLYDLLKTFVDKTTTMNNQFKEAAQAALNKLNSENPDTETAIQILKATLTQEDTEKS